MNLKSKRPLKLYCQTHPGNRIVQLGCSLTCKTSTCTICDAKNCISTHQQNERLHDIRTIEQVRHIMTQYNNSKNEKRAYLKKMVYEYFMAARQQVERLFTQVYESIDYFEFNDIIFHQDERMLIKLLTDEEYSSLKCADVASILPKIIKSTDFEDGHFTHLRNYLLAEKEKVVGFLNKSLLNLPQFRYKNQAQNLLRFTEISQANLRDVNTLLQALTIRPKKLRIKYSKLQINEVDDQGSEQTRKEFVRLLGHLDSLKDLQNFQIYCVWDVDDNHFQYAVAEALIKYPFLNSITIYTGYQVTSTDFLEPLIHNKNIEVRVYRKQWTF